MHGHLVIADISGYTQFLTESELDHANGILEELLNAVIGATKAPLTLSSIEGDAVFLYGTVPEGTIGQSILESVEALYISFAGALETMVLNTTCQCNACANIKALGLKIVMHCGEYAISTIGGRETLSGPDVIMTHRLLKNTVRETTGIDDYLLVTQACVDDLGLESIVQGWIPHSEEYEHVGEVGGYVASLKDVWEFSRSQNELKITQGEAWIEMTAYSTAPIGVVWDHMIDPIKRNAWIGGNSVEVVGDEGGRIGAGAEYHCAHGDDNDIAVMAVLDMRTNDYITISVSVSPIAGMVWTDYLIPSGTGTRIVSCARRPHPTTDEELSDELIQQFHDFLAPAYREQLDRLTSMAAEATASAA